MRTRATAATSIGVRSSNREDGDFFSSNDGQHRKVREMIKATAMEWSMTAVLHETDGPHHDCYSRWRVVSHVGADYCLFIISFHLVGRLDNWTVEKK
jgi:hypothetical protein